MARRGGVYNATYNATCRFIHCSWFKAVQFSHRWKRMKSGERFNMVTGPLTRFNVLISKVLVQNTRYFDIHRLYCRKVCFVLTPLCVLFIYSMGANLPNCHSFYRNFRDNKNLARARGQIRKLPIGRHIETRRTTHAGDEGRGSDDGTWSCHRCGGI